MRITSNILVNNFIKDLQANLKRLEKKQYQLNTGRSFQRASDDPVGVTRSLQARADLSRNVQYSKNIRDGLAWLSQTESTLFEINDLVARGYELAVAAASGTKAPEDLNAIYHEVAQLQEQLVHAANSSFNGRYIFGGYNTTEKPFEISGEIGESTIIYNGMDLSDITDPLNVSRLDAARKQYLDYEIGYDVDIPVSFTGIDLIGTGPDNLYAVFDKFSAILKEGADLESLNEIIGSMQGQQNRVLALLAETGGKQDRLELMEKRLETDHYNLTALKSNIEDVDYAKAVMECASAEIVYQSALAAGAKIIQPTLLDFLR